MTRPEGIKLLGLEIPRELHKRLRMAALVREQSVKDMLLPVLVEFIEKEEGWR